MNDLETSLISHFIKLGCSQQNAAATYQIYIELTQVRKLSDVNYYFDNNMRRMYLTAKNSNLEQEILFFPICTFETISFAMMMLINELNNIKQKSNYLAIISPDSTCVYYEILKGLTEFTSSASVSKLNKRSTSEEIFQKCNEKEQIENLKEPNVSQGYSDSNVNR